MNSTVSFLDAILGRRHLRSALAEKDLCLLSRAKTIADQQAASRNRDAAIAEREIEISARDTEIERLKMQIARLTQEASDRDTSLHAREAIILQHESRIAALTHILGERETSNESIGRELDADQISERLSEWKRQAVSRSYVQYGAQSFIDPYVVWKHIAGKPTCLLIATHEGQAWYDRFDFFEAPYVQALGMVGPGSIVLDCGANQGVTALAYSAIVGDTGHVHAFDPYQMNTDIAKFNAALNGRSNMTFYQQGIWIRPDNRRVSVAAQRIFESEGADSVEIDLITLDSLAGLRPDFIKMDIEGAEIDALESATEMLKTRPSIYLELHPLEIAQFGRSPEEIFKFIDLASYYCFLLYPGMPLFFEYERQFALAEPCALFFVPRERPPTKRFFPSA